MPDEQPPAPIYRRTGPPRTGEIVEPSADLAAVERLIQEAPADYPGLPLLQRRAEELRALATDENPRFVAPFRELIHNIHQFGQSGEHWSWRCGVYASTLDEQCKYDRNAGSWAELVENATAHLREHHDTVPAAQPFCCDHAADVEQLLAENERLRDDAAQALVRQTELKGMTVEEGATVLQLGPPRELIIAWVNAAREMLGDAPNYSETRLDFPGVSMEVKAAGEVDRYIFTVQRAGKVTPHEARQKAEAERDALRVANERLAASLATESAHVTRLAEANRAATELLDQRDTEIAELRARNDERNTNAS